MWTRGRMAGWILGKRMLRWSLGCGMLHGVNSWERKVRRQDGAREETELQCRLSKPRLAGRGALERRQTVTGTLVGLTLLGLPPPQPRAAAGRQQWLLGRRLPRTGNIQTKRREGQTPGTNESWAGSGSRWRERRVWPAVQR